MHNDDLNNDDFIWDEPEEPKKPKKVSRSQTPKPQTATPKNATPRPAQVSQDYGLMYRQRYERQGIFSNFVHHLRIYVFYNYLFRTLGAILIFIIFLIFIAIPNYKSSNSNLNFFDFIRQSFGLQTIYSHYYNIRD